MLRPLQEMVGGWAPKEMRTADPMVLIACTWEALVGSEVAQNTRPVRLIGETLHVTTTSGAWSQQLTFLEPQILQELRRFPETKSIQHMRFRVGRLHPRRVSSAQPRSQATARRPHNDNDEIQNCADPFERFRRRCIQRQKSAQRLCSGCGAALCGVNVACAPCAYEQQRERAERVQRIMYQTPQLSYEEIRTQVDGLTQAEYEEIRQGLLSRWWEVLERVERTGSLRSDGFERRIARSYLLLQSGLPLERISRAAARNLLGDRLEELLFGPVDRTFPSFPRK